MTSTLSGKPASDNSAAAMVAPDCRGMNFYRVDRDLRALLDLHMEPRLRAAMEPHLDRLGELAGGRLDELAEIADKHPPVLHSRDRFGRDEDWVEFHPAYREMERIGFGELVFMRWRIGPACSDGLTSSRTSRSTRSNICSCRPSSA